MLGLGNEAEQQQSICATVDQWITGIPGRIPDHAVFVENPEHLPYARKLAGEQSIVRVPNGDRGAAPSSPFPVSSLLQGKSSWLRHPQPQDPGLCGHSCKEFIVKSNSIVWLLLALIFGFYSIYIFSSTRADSLLTIISGVVLVAASLISLWKFLRDSKASKGDRNGQ